LPYRKERQGHPALRTKPDPLQNARFAGEITLRAKLAGLNGSDGE